MTSLKRITETLRPLLPGHGPLINQLAEQHADEPLRFLSEIGSRSLISHIRLCQLWADALGVAYVNPFNVELPSDPSVQLPGEVARSANALVLTSVASGVTVGMAQPDDKKLIESLRKALARDISPVFSHPDEIQASINLLFGNDNALNRSLERTCAEWPALPGGREIRNSRDTEGLLKGEAVQELFNSILLTAFRRRASDIHLEPGPDDARVRFRVDGDMCQIVNVPRAVHDALIVRIKVLSSLDVAQSRLPQDGAFELDFGGTRPAFRTSTLPSLYGEKGVLRLLGSPAGQSLPRLGALNMSDTVRGALRRVVLNPNGILIACGPTGSGKTTTLYACLGEINRPDLNIVTIEDPVEIRLPGLTQHQVNTQVGLTFGKVLRAILRQDPDVLLVGEIRDLETARIATEAALTGHLVLTSLHANNSLQAVTRLVEIGVEPYLVAPTTMGVLSQRLVRRICPACKESYKATHEELEPYFTEIEDANVTLYRGRGCPQCYGSGFQGRIGLHEFVEVSETMREMINHRAPSAQLMAEAHRTGYRTLRYDGLKKALIGMTTLSEIALATLPEMTS
ncbi:MAG: GspE/PulE family protein [Candidatus Didemnitutus sp.]|nr:GspE/PulE family protein [Candidatus Didemnitutus sp.]